MLPDMEEVTISAIVGELTTRALSFLIDACSRGLAAPPPPPPSEEERLDGLRRLLLRVGAVVEDAEGRRITNQAMLQQLDALRQEMQSGQFTLDALRCQGHRHGRDDEAPTATGHQSFTLSQAPRRAATRSGEAGGHGPRRRRVRPALRQVPSPAALRQPYSAHLVVDNSMFGRQMEMEYVVGFLLRGAAEDDDLGVLPIVGPRKVGKSTLVEHAIMDDWTRGFAATSPRSYGAGVMIKHKIRPDSSSIGEGRALMIVELDRDISEDSWRGLYGAARAHLPRGSKIIVSDSTKDGFIGAVAGL
ncbi:hypothetical protein ACP4OV_017716 [Aristida adscensionis]